MLLHVYVVASCSLQCHTSESGSAILQPAVCHYKFLQWHPATLFCRQLFYFLGKFFNANRIFYSKPANARAAEAAEITTHAK